MTTRRQFIVGSLALPFLGAAQSPSLRIVLTGQALLQHDLKGNQWPQADKFAKRFAGADVCFTDLETTIKGPHATTATRSGEFLHAAGVEIIDNLARTGFNMFATSNNHAFDFGADGIMDSVTALDQRGIAHAGTGADLARASAPGYRKTPHGTVALVAMASGALAKGAMATADHAGVNEVRRSNGIDLDEADVARYLAAIGEAASLSDIVIAYQHNHYWEKNMADTPAWQQALARRAVDAGASIFVSHGAPLLHGIEIYKGKMIFYDLGGFFFQTVTKPGAYVPEVWDSVIVDCRCTKAGFEHISLTPVQMNDTGLGGLDDMTTRGAPSLAEGETARKILQRLADMSAKYGTKLKIADGKAEIALG
jgi:poly-gamma-glutamate capsule biosynthesis protein CapA/YwtB (metallophosphatase superfamily)